MDRQNHQLLTKLFSFFEPEPQGGKHQNYNPNLQYMSNMTYHIFSIIVDDYLYSYIIYITYLHKEK